MVTKTSTDNIKYFQRTIEGDKLQVCQKFGTDFKYQKYTTLNERFNIFPDVKPNAGEPIFCKYLCIGAGGTKTVVSDTGITATIPIPHQPSDAACFLPRPFVLREIGNDLTPAEMSKFGGRTLATYDNKQYIAYYFRVIDLSDVDPKLTEVTVVDGKRTEKPFVPDEKGLYPTPIDIPTDGEIVSSDVTLFVDSKVSLSWDEFDVKEYQNVCKIIDKSSMFTILTEVGICAGVDRAMTGPDGKGGNIKYTERCGVFVTDFISLYQNLNMYETGMTFDINAGAAEGLATGTSVKIVTNNGAVLNNQTKVVKRRGI